MRDEPFRAEIKCAQWLRIVETEKKCSRLKSKVENVFLAHFRLDLLHFICVQRRRRRQSSLTGTCAVNRSQTNFVGLTLMKFQTKENARLAVNNSLAGELLFYVSCDYFNPRPRLIKF